MRKNPEKSEIAMTKSEIAQDKKNRRLAYEVYKTVFKPEFSGNEKSHWQRHNYLYVGTYEQCMKHFDADAAERMGDVLVIGDKNGNVWVFHNPVKLGLR